MVIAAEGAVKLRREGRPCADAPGAKCIDNVGGRAVPADPHTCGSEEHGLAPCRDEAIRMKWILMDGNHTAGLWKSAEVE